MFAARGRLRNAILALAALTLLGWVLDDVWSIPIHSLEFAADYGGMVVFVHHVIFPLVAVAGGVLALKDRRPGVACLPVCLPTPTWPIFSPSPSPSSCTVFEQRRRFH